MRLRLLHTLWLVMLGAILLFTNAGASLAQSTHVGWKVVWKGYSFPEDGFAITLPDTPRNHPDKNIANATVYSVNINPDYALTVRVIRDPRDCSTILAQLRESVVNRKAQETDPASLKEMALDGHPGLEYEWKVSEQRVGLIRYYCSGGRVYALAVNREKTQPLMPEARRILDSFRLLQPGAR